MVDKLKRLRQPAAWVMVAAVAVHALWMLVTFIWYAADGRFAFGNAGWLVVTQQSGVVVLAAALAVGACALWNEPSRNARLLTLLATIGFGVVIALGMIFAVIGGIGGATPLVMFRAGFLEAVVPALAAVGTFAVYRSLPAPVHRPRSSQPLPGGDQHGMPPQQPGGHPHQQGSAQPPSQWPYGAGQQRAPQQPYAPQQPPQQPPQRAPQQPSGQSWPPPQDPAGGWENRTPDVRSQFDQFENRHRNSAGDFPGFFQSQAPGEWQPTAQPPPQRFEPSPDQPPIGPHTNPNVPPDFDPNPNRHDDQDLHGGGSRQS